MSVMSVEETEARPQAAPPEPDPGAMDGPGEEPLCFMCLAGTCQHETMPMGHLASAVTMLMGTALCGDCARCLRKIPWYR